MLINDGGFLNIGNNNSKQASLVKTSRLGEKNAVSHGRSLVFMDGYNANLLSIIDKTRNPGKSGDRPQYLSWSVASCPEGAAGINMKNEDGLIY